AAAGARRHPDHAAHRGARLAHRSRRAGESSRLARRRAAVARGVGPARVMRRALVLLLLAGGCRFGVGPVDVDAAASDDLAVAVDGAADATAVDLASSDHAVQYDLRDFPDGGILPHAIGWPCSAASDCTGGLCVDGYCCAELCDPLLPQNLCKACNVPGFEGRCVLALAGSDPRGQCDQDPTSTCGKD